MSCPGIYCGRIRFENDTFSDCGACPNGFRSSNIYGKSTQSICIKCTDDLELYDYLFLLFILISQLTFEFYIIDKCIKRSTLIFETIVLYLSSFLEVFLAACLSFFVYAYDFADFKIKICKSYNILDWYTVFEDPVLDNRPLRCTSEIVWPLYSIVFFYLFLSFLFLLARSFVINKFKINNGSLTIYLTMYLIPCIGFVHFVFAGVIYYSYPYILLIGSIVSISIHFAFKLDQQSLSLFKEIFTNKIELIIVLGHCFYHGIALIALIEIKKLSYLLLLSVFIPSLFYILTSRFTTPNRFL